MEYTVQRLGRLAGVSARTLRYYDEIGILKPARINSSGYRIYGQAEVDRLQHILFYRELGLELEKIKEIMDSPAFNAAKALKSHHEQLLDKKRTLERLIENVEKTIAAGEGRLVMSDQEKFAGFKQEMIADNERQYGREIRAKYGDKTVDESNRKLASMSQEEFDEAARLAEEVKKTLAEALKQNDPAGELAQKAAELHKRWLMFYWTEYSKEAHAGLAQMYVDDERFTVYYDADQPGTAAFFRDAIRIYTGMNP